MERSGNEYEAPREEREMEFAARKDTQEDRVNDGKRYSGLLTKEDYDARKRGFAERIRAERDPEAYAKEKLDAAVAREVAIERAAADARRERERIRREKLRAELEVRSIHWFPYDRVRVVDADP
ncbi:uncharacterized protein MICPUCDRAFT_52542 [Micromonas pusilla CCMP1545]|jgi:CHAD domain-containing protein|uniref:Predicted protein n=1 Tax=Micromonas pusilla (strain CCMP1545) TaxID=564608 RepID=C1N4F9_MICPC|nr:uncharacterized protein MICPUCDRAFT_52542 [Micromonas pusilla CCMP1545]EEH52721.1 predicted protein [Micromonas pusilla CCMP1545]|eukprot:XP_003062782.1 predicted protein [Micromonas pusilla CCMP1545]